MKSIDVFAVRRIAAKYHLDPRTLTRALEGNRIRGLDLNERARRAVDELRGEYTPTFGQPLQAA